MKKFIPSVLPISVILFLMTCGVNAQEKTEVTIQVKKEGKIVKDTTYQFEDDADAKHAMKMFEILSGEHLHDMEFNYTMAHEGDEHTKAMVFVSKDGGKTEIRKIHGDSLVWVSEGEHGGGKHVVVVTSPDGETFDVLVDEENGGEKVKKEKRVKVVVMKDEHGSMHISEEEMIHSDEEIYMIKGDNVEKQLKEIMKKVEEGDGDNVKIIVIEKDK